MAAQPPSVAAPGPAHRFRWALPVAVLLLVLVAATAGFFVVGSGHGSSAIGTAPAADAPSATWAAGAARAPTIRLADENGRPVSLSALRGRPVLVTFIDPLCRNFCPIEAQHLNDAVHALPAGSKPAIVAVSVNVYGNSRANLLQDNRKWKLVPQWHWGVAGRAQLARVWKSYHIAVLVTTRKIAGVSVHDVAHTEAAYLIDKSGYERALFLWPYRAAAVVRAIEALR